MPLYLGLDVGTQSAKALVYDPATKTVLGRGSFPYQVIRSTVPGRAEQSPRTWLQGVQVATKQALSTVDASQIKCLGVSGQQHGLIALDDSGQVLRDAKLWCDTESAAEAEELSQVFGWTMVPSFTASKLLWLKRHERDVFDRMATVLLPHDYVNYWLTGRFAMECGDASGTGLLDVMARQWDRSAVNAIDPRLADCLPPLVGPNQPIGEVTASAAAVLGLPPGVLVAPGSGDNAMSALGVGAAADGQLVISLGSSGTLFARTPQPVIDPSGAIARFCDATGGGLPLACTLNCTTVPGEVAEMLGVGRDKLEEAAAKEPAGCGGVRVLPYLSGERTPNWPHATGVIHGLRPGSLRTGLLYRSALEGVTLSLLACLRAMSACGVSASEARLVGGGANSPLWRQIVADMFQMDIRLPLESESAALGAALQAAAVHSQVPVGEYVTRFQPPLAEQVVQPDTSLAGVYQDALEEHEQLGRRLFAKGA